MKKYLILVKHSLPQIVEDLPAREWKLSEEGRARAEKLAKELARFEPEVIISSQEPKATETAEIIADKFHLKAHVVEGLHEHERSNVSYLPPAEFQASVGQFFASPDELVFGTETARQAHTRFEHAIQAILESYKAETVVVVAHGTVIALFVSRLAHLSAVQLWHELGLPSFIVMDRKLKTLIVKNDII